MLDLEDHATHALIVGDLAGVVDAMQAEGADGAALILLAAVDAANLLDLDA